MLLKGKAIECISIIAVAVGPEIFAKGLFFCVTRVNIFFLDKVEVLTLLSQIKPEELDIDDPLQQFTLQGTNIFFGAGEQGTNYFRRS
jgi:hypothetical protein